MTENALADQLASAIALMQQELWMKRKLLEEARKKLQFEVAEHKETKSNFTQCSNENNELQVQLNISLEAAQNLESENAKIRENMVKLQVQTNAYLVERQQLLDRCYNAELENDSLKNELKDLKECLKIHETFQEKYKERQLQMEKVVDEIFRQQEILKKEQARLEAVSKEGLSFATKVSEEAQYQAKFVLEANTAQVKMEEEMIHLITALKEIKSEKNNKVTEIVYEKESRNYLEEWRLTQLDYKEKIRKLIEDNKRLTEELNVANSQIKILFQK